MSASVIETHGLTKLFGARAAVRDVDLAVPPGTCFGFLGPNGAGKTTLIRMLLGLARPTRGTIAVRGHAVPAHLREALARVGAMVEEPRFYPYLSAEENLSVFAAPLAPEAHRRIRGALARVGLEDRAGDRVATYSLGMRQRLGVARSLLSDPELLVLDEPSNGLDPAGIAEFRAMIRGFVEDEGRTVFLSSHLLDEIERTCDDVAIVNRGTVVAQGGIGALLAEGRRGLVVQVDRPDAARAVLAPIPAIRGVELGPRRRILVHVDPIDDHAAIQVNRILVEAGIGVAGLWPQVETLEQRYLALTADPLPGDGEHDSSLPTPAPPGVPRRRSEGRARRPAPRVRA